MKPETCSSQWLILFLVLSMLSACAVPGEVPTAHIAATGPPPSTQQFQDIATREPIAVPAPSVPAAQIRPSVIAGSWYPGDPNELAAMVDGFLEAVEPVRGEPIAVIVPHAGYVYSGAVAAYAFKQMEGVDYQVAVIIAADHQLPLSRPISVWAEGGFETPLGVVPIDSEVAKELVAIDPRIMFDPTAHTGEHGIEIELPFLQRVCPGCRIVPILMGSDDEESVRALADALLTVLPGRRAVVIASSDLSHYPAYQDARAVDGTTLAAIETGDPAMVRETLDALMEAQVPGLATCACGEGPILVAMRVAQGLGADTISVLHYANSGDVPGADREGVVGYGAVMFWRYQPLRLTQAQQKELLGLARKTIAKYLETGQLTSYATHDTELTCRSGAFVTLKKGGDLRGCIGHLQADMPLYRCVQEMAVAAATSDPRFPALTIGELDQVSIEISVLSPLRRITDTQQIQVGTHGLVIFQGGRQGVLLPQVPLQEGWDRQEFLENLCLKAGLLPNCWADQPALYVFTATVFGEEE